jgi:Protein of unknown function (DUF2877)
VTSVAWSAPVRPAPVPSAPVRWGTGPLISATNAGRGVPLDTAVDAVASVVGLFSAGFYLGVADDVFAVAGPSICRGPLHLILPTVPPAPRLGSAALIAGRRITTATCVIDMSTASRFDPHVVAADRRQAVMRSLAGLALATIIPPDLEGVWRDMVLALEAWNLDAVRLSLQGRGGGLTPTGDDVLAGVLLVAKFLAPDGDLPDAVAAAADTTALSRAFLRWAAKGHSIAPIHALIDAAAAGDHAAMERAGRVVCSIGSSSGVAMLAGLRAAAGAALVAAGRPGTCQIRYGNLRW